MDPKLRVMTSGPLRQLFDATGPITDAQRVRELSLSEAKSALPASSALVVARVGQPLLWLTGAERFIFWKDDVVIRLARETDDRVLEDFPDERAWTASEWSRGNGSTLVVVEEHH